jgi:Rieske Fe-S protein
MRTQLLSKHGFTAALGLALGLLAAAPAAAQTVAFPGAGGFGRYATGARGAASPSVYIVTNLNDSGPGSFRDAVSQPGRFVTFAVGGIITLQTNVQVAPNVTVAGQTAPGDGIVFFNKRITFTGSNNTICRYLRVRLGSTGNKGNDASGLANGSNIILDHMSFSWGMDEVFSINWDSKGTAPDNITVQNSIIGQGLHRDNHSAGGLIQTPDGGKVSLLQNLYISNKTRNPKVKGINEFVNNVVYDWGNGNRLGAIPNYGWSGEAYIMGGSAGVSEVNIINNYFVGGPLTPPAENTPFTRGTGTFNLFGSGNYFDNNRNGVLDGAPVPYDSVGYPGIVRAGFRIQPFAYPAANPTMTAAQAYQFVIDNAGVNYPRRDQVDGLLIDEVRSKGTQGFYVYNETDLPFSNGGLGDVFGAPAPLDTDRDGMPDAWEDAHGLNKNSAADALTASTTNAPYLNLEVYVNSLTNTPAPDFVRPPSNVQLAASTVEVPAPASQVVLTWADNSPNESYFVLERSTDGTTFTDVFHPAANATTYTDASLLPNITYYYRLKAITGAEASAYSGVATVKTPALPSAPAVAATPTPSDAFQYAELTNGTLALKWTGSANTLTYSVYFGTDPAALTKLADVPYAAAPSYTVTGLSANTPYYWRIDATNAKGTVTGTAWSFRTMGNIIPQLVGHWGFDETAADGTQIIDQSAFANNGVLGLDDDDQSIRVPGKVNNALDFATADQNRYVVSIPHQDQLYLDQSSFSLSFWMKASAAQLPQDNLTSAYLLCKGSITKNATTGATGKRFNIEFKNKQFRFAIDDDKNKDELQIAGAPFFTGQWVHVVALRDVAAKKIQVYMNGVLVKEMTTKALGIGEASDLIVGNIGELEFLMSTNAPAPYRGALDELRVYNYALSPAQIAELMKTKQTITFAALPNRLVGDANVNLGATSDSGLPIAYTSSDNTVATFSNGTLQLLKAGTVTITATQTGNTTFAAAAPVSQTLTIAPLLVKVLHQNPDVSRPNDNNMRINLQLVNDGTTAVPYQELTVRYWLIPETNGSVLGSVNWAELGTNLVGLRYATMPTVREGAYGYVEYSFQPGAGNLVGGGNSGTIVSTLHQASWGNFEETNDYSYAPNTTLLPNQHMAVYRNGVLVSGTEPTTAVVPALAFKALSENRNAAVSTNYLQLGLQLNNRSNVPVNYEDLRVRYWLNPDGASPMAGSVNFAPMGASNITLTPGQQGAETYLELSFSPTLGQMAPYTNTGEALLQASKTDWSAMSQANDHSYVAAGPLAENSHVTVYYQGQLVYGVEPTTAAARQTAASQPADKLQVAVLGNPITGSQAEVEISGVAGQPVQVVLMDFQGTPKLTQRLASVVEGQRQLLPVANLRPGVYLLKVTSADQSAVVRLLKE